MSSALLSTLNGDIFQTSKVLYHFLLMYGLKILLVSWCVPLVPPSTLEAEARGHLRESLGYMPK